MANWKNFQLISSKNLVPNHVILFTKSSYYDSMASTVINNQGSMVIVESIPEIANKITVLDPTNYYHGMTTSQSIDQGDMFITPLSAGKKIKVIE